MHRALYAIGEHTYYVCIFMYIGITYHPYLSTTPTIFIVNLFSGKGVIYAVSHFLYRFVIKSLLGAAYGKDTNGLLYITSFYR